MTAPYPRYYAVADRPVELRQAAGAITAYGLELTSGALRRDDSLRATVEADKQVDELSRAAWLKLVTALRRVIPHDRQVTPLTWVRTDDPEYPFRTEHAGTVYMVRLGDFPVEAQYHLEVDGEVVDALDDWPKAWTRLGEDAPKWLTNLSKKQ